MAVSGTVRDFAYEEYADNYGLPDQELYNPYGDEEIIEASDVDSATGGTMSTS